ncbi:MAG TPA: hypothetical protein VFM13_10310, partial [Gaiellaceae bacterium]|nr:hypothetical protein [Gaiellaceae bacterium]
QNDLTVNAGTYDVTEPAVAGYTTTYNNCTNVVVANGGSATCTVTNDDLAPSLTLVKVVTNDNGGTAVAGDFILSADGPTPISGAGGASSGASFDQGTYTLAETSMPGYTAGNWSCIGGTQNGSSITVGLGGAATCTITNDDKAPSLTLLKTVISDNGGTALPEAFTLAADGPTPISGAGFATSDAGFQQGTYGLSETTLPGYTAGGWTCDGGTQNGSEITVGLGESATCTITNDDQAPSLTLVKQVINDNAGTATAGDFILSASGPTPISGAGGASSDPSFDQGTYALSETTLPGYAAGKWSCVGGTQNGSEITVGLGGTATCTITNDDQAPSLTLVKQVINDNGGTATAGDFILSASGPTPISGAGFATSDPGFQQGTYGLSETTLPGYTAGDWTCDGGIQNGSEITVGLGEAATCTVTNDDQPGTLTVKKVVVNDNGGKLTFEDFSFEVNGGSAVAFEGDGQNDLTVDAGTYSVVEPAVAGYSTTYGNCTDVVIPNGGTATCTVTNDDQPGTLIVKKVVVNDNGGTLTFEDFSFEVNGGSAIAFEGDGQNDLTVNAGTYDVTEPAVPGYTTTYDNCTDVVIPNGGTATCTVTNDDVAPQLVVIKHVDNDNGGTADAGDFTLDSGGTNDTPDDFAGAEAPGITVTLDAGSYNVTETGPAGYAASFSADCAGSIAVGETKTCTVTNDDIQPSLVVVKHVVNDNGGTAAAGDFAMMVFGNPADHVFAGDESGTLVSIDAGSYSVGETGPSGYAASYSADCSGSIAVGETKTCTVTNDDIAPKLTLTKVIVGGDGTAAESFDVLDDGTTKIDDAAAPSTSEGPYDTTIGTHTITETLGDGSAVPSSNWDVVYSGDCTTGGEVTLDIGQSKSCTITNSRRPEIEVVKNLVPETDPGRFDLKIGNTTYDNGGSGYGDAGTTGFQPVATGNHTVSELGHGTTSLAKYTSTVDCGTFGSSNGTSHQVTVGYGDKVTCTITNTRNKGKLTVQKDLVPSTDAGRFDLKIGSTVVKTNAGDEQSGSQMLDPGTYAVSEAAGTTTPATDLANYDRSVECKTAGGGTVVSKTTLTTGSPSVDVAIDSGDDITCTITNGRLPTLKVIKHVVGGSKTAAAWSIHVKTGDPATDVTGSPQAGSETGTTYTLSPGTYAASESGVVNGYLFKGFSGDCNATDGTVTLDYGQNKTCTLTNETTATSAVTDSALCTFDYDSGTAGDQFRLLYTPSPQSAGYKLNASNPGQFYYNVFYAGTGGDSVTLTLPYPFVTQGAVAVHVYSSVDTVTTPGGQTCYVPGDEIGHYSPSITLGDYATAYDFTQTVNVPVSPVADFAYINIHLDYGLKGTAPYAKDGSNNAVDPADVTKVLIPDLQEYGFTNSVGPGDSVMSRNVFKKNPGIAGLVLKSSTTDPVGNAKAQIYQGTKLMTTQYADEDGWFMWQYKYTGKATTFTVKLPAYGLSKAVTLKANGFVAVDFLTP